MNVLVTGATGFVGRHVVERLLSRGHVVAALARDTSKALILPWFERVTFIASDIYEERTTIEWRNYDTVVHLAWSGLPNYDQLFHFEENLIGDYRFLKAAVAGGIKHILVTGTCFEYGLRDGCLAADDPTAPANPYALAKDTLHKFLRQLCVHRPFALQWARLFYMYGEGQNPRSLMGSLERAAAAGEATFPMTGGEQLRDYLPIAAVADQLVALVERSDLTGPLNICSGRPISVRALVEQRLREIGSNMALDLGAVPYSPFEPIAFWGDRGRLAAVLGSAQ